MFALFFEIAYKQHDNVLKWSDMIWQMVITEKIKSVSN